MRAVEQTLDIFERFAEAGEPLAPAELARRLAMPPSTCFNLLRTFERRGYIYTAGARRALYPTKRMLRLAQRIARHDPVDADITGVLGRLRDETEETIVLASRSRDQVTYLDVFESPQRIRYSAAVGETRPIQVNSMGKALLSLLGAEERQALAASIRYEAVTDRTLVTADAYLADIELSIGRGWFLNDGESYPDVVAVAVPVIVHGSALAITLAAPRHRMQGRIEERARQVQAACRAIASQAGERSAA